MALTTQPYKGTRDLYPADMRIQQWMFNKMREVVERYSYQEYDGPMLEPFELYAAKSGEELVNQQIYSLIDRGERKLAIRPEMTPTLARMVAGKINELPRPVRWFSIPNLWRYERPQRGRLREHWQLNVDVLGGDAILADAEILMLGLDLMKAFGGENFVSVKVNDRRLMDHFFTTTLGLTPEAALQTELRGTAETIARSLRDAGLSVMTPLEAGGFGAQLKLANKHAAHFAVILGDAELAEGKVVLKDLSKGEQFTVAIGDVAAKVRELK